MSAAGATASRTDRSYRLLEGERGAEGLRRVAAGRADSALEEFRETAAADPAAGIHEGRKDLKKLRSVLRLVRDALGEETYQAENDRFRQAGRLLSDARDAEAKLETVSALRAWAPAAFPATAEPWTEELERDRRRLPEAAARGPLQEAIELVAGGRDAIAQWPLEGDSFELIAPGLKRAYRRGCRRLADVDEDPSGERVHEWRKRVKDLWYMQRILVPLWPASLEPFADEAHTLASRLGDHHDLTVLSEDARSRSDCFDGAGLAELLELCRRRQAELLEDALPLGRRLYAEKPKSFVARFGAYWESPA